MIGRILTRGGWKANCWLRKRATDDGLRAWLIEHRGADLGPKQLRYWELILDLPKRQVDSG